MQVALNNVGKGAACALVHKQRQQGMTLVELSIAVVIGAVMLGVGLKLVVPMLNDTKVNAEITELPLIITKIQKMYSNRASFNGITTQLAISNDIFPNERVAGPAIASNRWGGNVTVVASTLNTPDDAVTLTHTRIDSSACKALIPQVEGYVRTISVGGTMVKADGAQSDLTTLGTQCTAGGASNTIAYTFGR